MDKVCKIIAVVIIMIIITSLPLWADSEWKEVKNKKGVRIETRKVKGSPMKEFKSQCIVDAPIEVVYEIAKNASTYVNWFADCVDKQVVQKIDDHNYIGYQVVNLPFPFHDRDTVATVQFITDWDAGRAVIKMNAIKPPDDSEYGMDKVTSKNKRVRMPKMDGIMILTRVAPDKTEMIYQAHVDPGAPLPSWVINLFSNAHPYKSLLGMKKEAKKEIYYKRAEETHNREFAIKSHIK